MKGREKGIQAKGMRVRHESLESLGRAARTRRGLKTVLCWKQPPARVASPDALPGPSAG